MYEVARLATGQRKHAWLGQDELSMAGCKSRALGFWLAASGQMLNDWRYITFPGVVHSIV